MAGSAVITMPITMNSAIVVAWKSGGGRYSIRVRTVGMPSTVTVSYTHLTLPTTPYV